MKWHIFGNVYGITVHLIKHTERVSYVQTKLESEADRTIDGYPLLTLVISGYLSLKQERHGEQQHIVYTTIKTLTQIPFSTNSL